jgi:hypothetical protein
MTRRELVKDEDDKLEIQCFNLFPERWKKIYDNSGGSGDWGQAFGGEPEIPVTNPDDLDRFFGVLANQRGMTAEQAERMLSPINGKNAANSLGYIAEGTGRRV